MIYFDYFNRLFQNVNLIGYYFNHFYASMLFIVITVPTFISVVDINYLQQNFNYRLLTSFYFCMNCYCSVLFV
jgi:hypothetical protein